MMRFSKITTCDICNGLGIGVVLWCQGCDINCKNCHNKETWDFNGGKPFTALDFNKLIEEVNKPYISRLTLSGGHPLAPQNIETSAYILQTIKSKYPNKSTWVYTGYIFENIKHLDIMKYIDVLVDGSFVQEKRDITLPYRGSSNQRIIDVQQSLKENKVVLYNVD